MVQSGRLGLCVSLLVLLGACGSFMSAFTAEDNIEAARGLSAPEGSFNEFLRQEYVTLAQIELDENDFKDADIYARKALAAGAAALVLPEDPANRRVSAEKASELNAAREVLVKALDDGGRDIVPADAAPCSTAGPRRKRKATSPTISRPAAARSGPRSPSCSTRSGPSRP